MANFKVLHIEYSEDLKCVSVHVDSDIMIHIHDIYSIVGSHFDFIFIMYAKRPSVFNAVVRPRKAIADDVCNALTSIYPSFGAESWNVYPKFAALKDPRDIMLMRLSY